ncbi:MAG TPA: response regulator [Geobacteraceae bacterium]
MEPRKKVLLADDVELFIDLAATFFNQKPIDLLVARNGRQALDLIRQEQPDLVFMDLYMPELDGDVCCALIKADPTCRQIPIIMVTQGGREAESARCREAGCDELIFKPLNRQEFLAMADRYLGSDALDGTRYLASVWVQFAVGGQTLTNYSINLSSGGLFLESVDLLPVDTLLVIEILLPGQAMPICCASRVAWVNLPEQPLKPELPGGMGLQFCNLPMQEMAAIREFIRTGSLVPTW